MALTPNQYRKDIEHLDNVVTALSAEVARVGTGDQPSVFFDVARATDAKDLELAYAVKLLEKAGYLTHRDGKLTATTRLLEAVRVGGIR